MAINPQIKQFALSDEDLDKQVNDAMKGVNTVLADSPGQKGALAMRGRIETAQNDWGW